MRMIIEGRDENLYLLFEVISRREICPKTQGLDAPEFLFEITDFIAFENQHMPNSSLSLVASSPATLKLSLLSLSSIKYMKKAKK